MHKFSNTVSFTGKNKFVVLTLSGTTAGRPLFYLNRLHGVYGSYSVMGFEGSKGNERHIKLQGQKIACTARA